MFLTHEDFRSPFSSLYGDSGTNYWLNAEVAHSNFWFLLTFSQVERNECGLSASTRTVMLGSDAQIENHLSIIRNEPEYFRFKSLQIVSPHHANGSSSWMMEVLDKVWTAREPEHGDQLASIYETRTGNRYCNSLLGTPLKELIVESLKFEIPPFAEVD